MSSFNTETESIHYDLVAKMFVELRGHGVSLSAVDLDILEQWEKNGIAPKFICQVMIDTSLEYEKKGKTFPKSLVSISKRIDKILVKLRDV